MIFLGLLLPSAGLTENSQSVLNGSITTSPLEFTLETKETSVQFFEPLTIRVVLRNNSRSSISLNTKNLSLHAEDWHVVGSSGAWSGDTGEPIEPEEQPAGQVNLPAGASLRLVLVDQYPTYELLGPVRVAYTLSSSDAATKRLLPTERREASFDVPPTKLISEVWAAQSEADRRRVKSLFADFLRLLEQAAEDEKQEKDLQTHLRNNAYAARSLYFMAGYALPFLLDALKDDDPIVRKQAILAYAYASEGISQLNAYLTNLNKIGPLPPWAGKLAKNHNRDQADWRAFALRALTDRAPEVRIAGLTVLTATGLDPAGIGFMSGDIGVPETPTQRSDTVNASELDTVRSLAKDTDPGVRAAVQEYLKRFAGESGSAETISDALLDPNQAVREKAIQALQSSPQPPPLETLKRAFTLVTGKTAIALIPLLLEQEDSSLAATLSSNFEKRSSEERLAILSAVAGHADSATLELIKSGLSDSSPSIQRTALLRLLAFPAATVLPVIDAFLKQSIHPEVEAVAEAVRDEVETRRHWPFLRTSTSASETTFPSRNGRKPLTSPDGQWLAYEETGYGRPGGTGGFGRSNLISISHVVRTNGSEDRVVSDMFLISWLSDSACVGTARDAYAAISNFKGNVVAEFGKSGAEKSRYSSATPSDWTKGELRAQFGSFMPHHKRLDGTENYGFGEGAAFSPDGAWYGLVQDSNGMFFLAADGRRMPIKVREGFTQWTPTTTWSPDGRYVQLSGKSGWLIIDLQTRLTYEVENVDDSDFHTRSNPWSSDGSHLVFVRSGQIWVSDFQGKNARQLTFDDTWKAAPRFSRDGRSVAYLTWQSDNRGAHRRLGLTDLWVVDVTSSLAIRVTSAASKRIESFDWVDDHTLIFDRLKDNDESLLRGFSNSSLHRVSLTN